MKPSNKVNKSPLYQVKDIAKMLNMSESWVYKAINQNKIVPSTSSGFRMKNKPTNLFGNSTVALLRKIARKASVRP